jgi:hypothetical protein
LFPIRNFIQNWIILKIKYWKGAIKMEKYLIEVPHEATKAACNNAVRIFLQTGSHFLRQADWGCHDGEHKAWLIVEVENKDQALQIVPSLFRSVAKIVKLHTFTREEMENIEEVHPV